MKHYEKIAVLDDRFQAQVIEAELVKREIPHRIRSFHDSAYDGLFQLSKGWGRLDAPAEHKAEILAIMDDLSKAQIPGDQEAGLERTLDETAEKDGE